MHQHWRWELNAMKHVNIKMMSCKYKYMSFALRDDVGEHSGIITGRMCPRVYLHFLRVPVRQQPAFLLLIHLTFFVFVNQPFIQ